MEIITQHLSKRFTSSKWILRDINLHFISGNRYGISGPNGSGKSTLLSLLAGLSMPSKGEVYHKKEGHNISPIHWQKHLSIAAPYSDLFDYLSLNEIVEFNCSVKKLRSSITHNEFLRITKFHEQQDQLIKNFSSGMKQRLKLGLAILTESNIIFLDEPRTNLDATAQDWYIHCLDEYTKDAMVIIASNDMDDFGQMDQMIELE
ncbi:MAG: ATP-binding cassette domain-containing protein [Saprospiraceae bacterium]